MEKADVEILNRDEIFWACVDAGYPQGPDAVERIACNVREFMKVGEPKHMAFYHALNYERFAIQGEGEAAEMTYDCPFCGKQPERETKVTPCLPLPIRTPEIESLGVAFCTTEGCPAFSNVVSVEVWNARRAPESKVAKIPEDEPIFVLRAQDSLGLAPIYFWLEKAEKYNVSKEKVQSALAVGKAFHTWMNTHTTKIPD